MSRILYNIFTGPPTQPEVIFESRWHQPLSVPVLRIGLTAAVVATTTFFAPLFTPVVAPSGSDDVSFAGSQTVVPYQQTLLYQSIAAPVPFEAPSVNWAQPLSQPTRREVRAQPDALSYAYFTPAAGETITVDKWLAPFAVPTRRNAVAQQDELAFVGLPDTATAFRWFAPFSEPVRAKPKVQPDALSWAYFTPPAGTPGTDDVRFSGSQTVVPYERTLLYQSIAQPVVFTTAEVVTVDKWFASLAQPTLRKPTVYPAAFSWSNFTPALSTGWIPALSEPTRRKPTVHPDAATFHPFPVTVEAYGWRAPFSEPTRRQVRIQPDAQAWSYFTPASAEVVTVDKWYAPFAEQARVRVGLPAQLQNPFTFDPFPRTVAEYRWQQSLAEPTRRKPTVQPDGLVFTYFVEAAELVTLDKWYQSFGVPPRLKLSAQQGVLAFHPFPVTVAEYRWQQPLAEPTRRVWPAAQQPALFFVGPDVAVNKWLVPFSEPTRRKPTVQPDALNWSYTTPALATDWIGPLSQPTYRIRFAEYPAVSWSTFTPTFFPGDATSLQVDFFNQLQQPTRQVWSPTTFTFFWLAPSGEPGPTPVTVAPAQPGGYWYEKWEELGRLSRRCKDDDECREAFAEAVEATEAVLATIAADASLGRLKKAIARAAEARDLAYALRCCENIRKELTKLNAELMQARAEADEEEEEAIALLLLH